MYCHTSSSVQLLMGNTRKCSPGCRRVLNSVHSSGRWALGCHWPKLSRWLKMRSLARAFSSSRRAPPIRASKRNSSIASSSVTDWCTLRDSPGWARRTVPRAIEYLHAAHDQLGAQFLRAEVAEVGHLGEVVARVDHQERVGNAGLWLGAKGLFGALEHDQRILAAREQQGGALEGGGDFAQDEDGFFFQGVQVRVVEVVELISLVFIKSSAESVQAFMGGASGSVGQVQAAFAVVFALGRVHVVKVVGQAVLSGSIRAALWTTSAAAAPP